MACPVKVPPSAPSVGSEAHGCGVAELLWPLAVGDLLDLLGSWTSLAGWMSTLVRSCSLALTTCCGRSVGRKRGRKGSKQPKKGPTDREGRHLRPISPPVLELVFALAQDGVGVAVGWC